MPYVWLFRTEWVVARTDRVHNARNVTLPDGRVALAFDNGTYRLTETWVSLLTARGQTTASAGTRLDDLLGERGVAAAWCGRPPRARGR